MLNQPLRRFHWKALVQPWQNLDGVLLGLVIVLTFIGGLAIRSVELTETRADWVQHWLTGGVGVMIALAIARWRYEALSRAYWLIYALTNLALLVVIFAGTTANGAQSWLTLGNFNVQPSEFAKVGLIITLAGVLQERSANTVLAVIKALVITAIPWVLIMLQDRKSVV